MFSQFFTQYSFPTFFRGHKNMPDKHYRRIAVSEDERLQTLITELILFVTTALHKGRVRIILCGLGCWGIRRATME